MKDTKNQGLYNPLYEHDACGIGFVANLKGKKSHKIVSDALSMLTKMEHRGACGCETNTGDGAGILIQVPHDFFKEVVKTEGFEIPAFGEYGVGQIFFPPQKDITAKCKALLEETISKFGFEVLGFRSVGQQNHMIGNSAKAVEPNMEQVFVKKPVDMDAETFERKLFVIRNYVVHTAQNTIEDTNLFYIATFSYKTIGYKGMLSTEQVEM